MKVIRLTLRRRYKTERLPSHEPLLSCHAACCVLGATVRTISGWFSSAVFRSPTFDPSLQNNQTSEHIYRRLVVVGGSLSFLSFLVFGWFKPDNKI